MGAFLLYFVVPYNSVFNLFLKEREQEIKIMTSYGRPNGPQEFTLGKRQIVKTKMSKKSILKKKITVES